MVSADVDATAALHLVSEDLTVAPGHELLAPTLLRSQALSLLHEDVFHGRLDQEVARRRLDALGRLKIRLLGDAVMRRTAWQLAEQLGWAETYGTEYLALTRLQGDAFVTLDEHFARTSHGVVPLAPVSALTKPA